MNTEKTTRNFREFISEASKSSGLTAKEVKYAVQTVVDKHYSVSPIRDITGNAKKLKITGKTFFSEKFIEILINGLNETLGTNFVKESYEEYKGIAACGLTLVNKQ